MYNTIQELKYKRVQEQQYSTINAQNGGDDDNDERMFKFEEQRRTVYDEVLMVALIHLMVQLLMKKDMQNHQHQLKTESQTGGNQCSKATMQ